MTELLIVFIFSITAVILKKVSVSGGIAGGIISFFILYNQWVNFVLFGLFFVLGTLATKWQYDMKKALGLSQENEGLRTWIHAVSNGGVPAFFSLLALYLPEYPFLTLAATGAIASALSDTLSSELGNIYGKRYVNILNFKLGRRGNDGVISLEGTLSGVLGSFLIATLYSIMLQDFRGLLPIAVAGFLGNIADSYLGATLQQKGWIDNHLVNLINTFIAAILVVLWGQFF